LAFLGHKKGATTPKKSSSLAERESDATADAIAVKMILN
jgi:hypothetical protein